MVHFLGIVAQQTKSINHHLGKPYRGIDMQASESGKVQKLYKKATLAGTRDEYMKLSEFLDELTLTAIGKAIWDQSVFFEWGNIV
jgi:hypothetical protein